jgi:hypothetical protein
MKKTQWFPADKTPAHDGLYETLVGDFITWSVWKDGAWHYACEDKKLCVEKAAEGRISFWQKREWRGLVQEAA